MLDRLSVGKRNYLMLRKLFWKNNILISAESIGGNDPRTLHLQIGTGRVWINSVGAEWEL
jgi:chemotaxis protein CheD